MARFLVIESEASLRWLNVDYIRTIEASTNHPNSTTVTFSDGTRHDFALPVEQFLNCKKIEY